MEIKFNVGDKVKINLDYILSKENPNKISELEMDSIKEFAARNNGIHEITQIITKGKYTKDVTYRIELDREYVFYEKELIKA